MFGTVENFESEESSNIKYHGLKLDSKKEYYWKVRIYDEEIEQGVI